MKTIKQIADELGVSKQRVYRFIVRNHITASSEVKQSKLYDEAAEKLIKQGFLEAEPHQKPHHEAFQNRISDAVGDTVGDAAEKPIKQAFSGNQTETKNANHEVSDLVAVLETSINVLKAELEAKDRQIEKLQMLLDQEQQLHALTAQQRKALPEQKEPDTIEDKKWWQFWK